MGSSDTYLDHWFSLIRRTIYGALFIETSFCGLTNDELNVADASRSHLKEFTLRI